MTAVSVGVLVSGEVRLGIWCEHCLLMSRFEVDLFLLGDDGLSPAGTVSGCTENRYQPHEG
jgi:hypothetical protein